MRWLPVESCRAPEARATCGAWGGSRGASSGKKLTTLVPSASATRWSEVSASEERPRSTSERKLIEKPVSRERSRSERPRSCRSARIPAPISPVPVARGRALCAVLTVWRRLLPPPRVAAFYQTAHAVSNH